MTDGLKLYTDHLCTKIGTIHRYGQVAITGQSADLSNWGSVNGIINKSSINPADFVFSGGDAVYDLNVPYNLPYPEPPTEFDYSSDWQYAGKIWNPLFISIDSETQYSYSLAINVIKSGNGIPYQFAAYLYNYTQTPFQTDMRNRTYWGYGEMIAFGGMQEENPGIYSQLKFYAGTIQDQQFIFVVLNVAASGETSASLTRIMGIPRALFDGLIPGGYPGQETESNSETAYTPTTPYRGSILSRDLTGKRNPYGFNEGNGLSLVLLSYTSYAAILQGIYAGTAESVLNKISQGFAQIVGGNSHRPTDEVQGITNAILCCHMIPQITGYASGTMNLRTIAGYHILGGNGDSATYMTLNKTANTIFQYDSSTYYLTRRLNSFLDFEPYTSIQLHLPFMPVLDVKPSILWGNGLKLHYTIDIYTGILSCDVHIIDVSENPSRDFILTTMQTNVKTDIPIMGNAAQNSAFSGITSAIIGAMGGKDDSAIIAAGISAADDLSKMGTGNAVGKSSIDGIGAYLSNRQPYFIITRPIPSVPSNYLDLTGSPSKKDGIVSDFKGFSVFDAVDLSGVNATDAEKKEIESMMKAGCFV